MAITTVGFDGTVTEAQFARLMRHHGEVNYRHGVSDGGMTVTAAGATRTVSIAAGTAVVASVLVTSDATASLVFAANATATTRTDYVVLRVDWTTNTAAFVVVQGSSAAAPTLTQSEGTSWDMPLARVAIRPSVGTLASTDIVVCKPLPRIPRIFRANIGAIQLGTVNGSVTTIEPPITVGDPGWPYHLRVTGAFSGSATGAPAQVSVRVNILPPGAATGSTLAVADGYIANGGSSSVVASNTTSTTLSGPVTAQLTLTAHSGAAGLGMGSAGASFTVEQIPA